MDPKIPLIGYTNALSFRPGDAVEVKVSSTIDDPYRAELVRIVSGDPNPDGPGMIFEPVPSDFEGNYPSRPQATHLGSYMTADLSGPLPDVFTLSSTLWPTLPGKPDQGVLALVDGTGTTCLAMEIGPDGMCVGGVDVGAALMRWRWYHVSAEIDAVARTIRLTQTNAATGEAARAEGMLPADFAPAAVSGIRVATTDPKDPKKHYNGKIEAPEIANADGLLAAWDFSAHMSSMNVPGTGEITGEGRLEGAPTRAMTGVNWDAVEMNWTRAPEQWAAIHFHDDDIADCNWETDFTFTVPAELRSGVYGIKLTGADH